MGRLTDFFSDHFSSASSSDNSGSESHDWTDAFGTACPMQGPSEADYGETANHPFVDTSYWRDDD